MLKKTPHDNIDKRTDFRGILQIYMLLILTPVLVNVENPFKVNRFDHQDHHQKFRIVRKRLDSIETDRLSSSTLNQPDKEYS